MFLLCVGYGLLVGSYYSLSGNINKLVTPNLGDDISQKDKSKHAGKMGLIMIVAGSVASLAAGCILDAAKKYKVSVCLLFWYIAILQNYLQILDTTGEKKEGWNFLIWRGNKKKETECD